MKRISLSLAVAALLGTGGLIGCSQSQEESPEQTVSTAVETDQYEWLEDVESETALNWVREQNQGSAQRIETHAEFSTLQADLLQILNSDANIPYVSKQGDFYYNFWRDQNNPQGLWRRTTLNSFASKNPKWDVIIDLDALSKAEDTNWVWRGADCLRPSYDRCLVSLSRGGADAIVIREFDMSDRGFVAGGFTLPESKGGASWKDADSIYVFTDFGDGTMTSSGYPRIAKQWQRGTALADAAVVYEGTDKDMYIAAYHDHTPGFERDFVSRTLAFYNNELYMRYEDGSLAKIDAPNSANKSVYRDLLILELRDAYQANDQNYAAGSLIAANFNDFMAGKREFDVLFEPSENTSLAGFSPTKNHLILNVLEDVKNRLYVLSLRDGQWQREPLKGAPAFGTVSASAVDDEESDDYWLTVTDYLTPTTLMMGSIGKEPKALKQLPVFFDASGFEISQQFATSKDGTKVPYFMVAKKGIELNGANPTLLYGYGGFEISLTPSYSATVGRSWLSQGGVYVVANIRGGGEYGPRWHQAALKENRLRAYEDFAAVAEDLIARKITAPAHLGIRGGSNGGLLVGNMTVLYPELFGAVVCQVPLLDMKRYHKLLAGASWMAEYGDPDKPEEWEFIKTYSPYQNVRADATYPPVLFTTSTRDDRVHPGHARKMHARMLEQGHDVTYFENIEGGHGGAANNKQRAHMDALAYTFLRQKLFKEN